MTWIAGLLALAIVPGTLDDLERRALAALDAVPHSTNFDEMLRERQLLKARIEERIGLAKILETGATAKVHVPERLVQPAPAMLILNNPSLAAGLTRLGFIVMEVDAPCASSDFLIGGVAPHALLQHSIGAALRYLKARSDVDKNRIGLAGPGLPAALVAALHPDIAAVAVLGGIPDFKGWIRALGKAVPNPCALVPGLVHDASARELIAMLAPRPLLTIGATRPAQDAAADVYRTFAAGDKLNHGPETTDPLAMRQAVYRWFMHWLQPSAPARPLDETPTVPEILPLGSRVVVTNMAPTAFNVIRLPDLLGAPLPTGPLTMGLNVHRKQEIRLHTQPGITIPATVYRTGPEGGGASRSALIVIDDRGRQALEEDPVVKEAYRQDWLVYAIDPRGLGELAANADAVFALSLLLGENFVWRQAADVLRIFHFTRSTAIYARGPNASLIAAFVGAQEANGTKLSWIALRDPLQTFESDPDLPAWALPFAARIKVSDLWAATTAKVLTIRTGDEVAKLPW